jgi:ATP-dependent Clp protease protease subunit
MSAKLFTVNNKADHAEVLISGPIGGSFWDDSGMTEKAFLDALADIPKGKPLVIGVNSEGGSIQDGLGIFNAIKRWEGPTTARIDGYAVSIASVIPLAAQRVISPKSSIWMIHEPWMVAQGNAEDMRKAADVLEKHGETLASIYESETGMSAEEVRAKMKSETWFRGDEAVALGFADESPDGAVALNSFDATKFSNVPTDILSLSAPAGAALHQSNIAASARTEQAQQTLSEAKEAEETTNKPAVTTAQNQNSMTEQNTVAADNAAILAKLEALENKLNAPAPLAAAPKIENLGNPLVEKFNSFTGESLDAKARFVRANHIDLRNALIGTRKGDLGVKAANTVDANLVNSVIAGDFLTTMRTKMAPLAAFSHQVSLSPLSARQVLNVNLLSTAGATQDNPTNFETGDTTSTAKQVTVAHISRSFHTTNAEQDLGLELMQKAPTNALVMAEGIMAKVTALMTNANYGADVVIGTAANFDATDLPAILALGKNYARTTLLLDGGHLAYLLPTSRESFTYGEAGAYGFDGGIYKNNLWTSAATDICGLVCGPDAIVWAAGLPASGPSGAGLSSTTVSLPEIGISVQANTWYALGSRAMWASFDVCFGAAVGDASQAEVLTTA